MFKVKMIGIGRCKEAWLNAALAEYEKRMEGRCHIEWLLAGDDEALVALCRKEKLLVALDIKGELFSSEALSDKLLLLGSRAAFVIGGPDGIPEEVLKMARWRWSLSPLTFTNQIARLLVVEQIYRALEIAKGSPYHK